MSKTEKPKPKFEVLAGDPQTFISHLLALREKYIIRNQWISSAVITVTPQDYESMIKQLAGNPELIAKIPKAQTTVMLSGLFEVAERNAPKLTTVN